jgi:hypothetical protein
MGKVLSTMRAAGPAGPAPQAPPTETRAPLVPPAKQSPEEKAATAAANAVAAAARTAENSRAKARVQWMHVRLQKEGWKDEEVGFITDISAIKAPITVTGEPKWEEVTAKSQGAGQTDAVTAKPPKPAPKEGQAQEVESTAVPGGGATKRIDVSPAGQMRAYLAAKGRHVVVGATVAPAPVAAEPVDDKVSPEPAAAQGQSDKLQDEMGRLRSEGWNPTEAASIIAKAETGAEKRLESLKNKLRKEGCTEEQLDCITAVAPSKAVFFVKVETPPHIRAMLTATGNTVTNELGQAPVLSP